MFTKFNFVLYYKKNVILDWDLTFDSPKTVRAGRGINLYASVTWKELDTNTHKPVSYTSIFLFSNTLLLGGFFGFLVYNFNHRRISITRLLKVVTLRHLSALWIGIGTSLYASLLLFTLASTVFRISYPKAVEVLVICMVLGGFVFGYEGMRKGRMFGRNMYISMTITAVVIGCITSVMFVLTLTEHEQRQFPMKKAITVYGCVLTYVVMCCVGTFSGMKSVKQINKYEQGSILFVKRPLVRGSLISSLLIFMVIFNDMNKIIKATFTTDVYTGWISISMSIAVSSLIFAYNNANAIITRRKHQIYQFPSVIIDSLIIFTVLYSAATICTYLQTGLWSVSRFVVIACGILAITISSTGTTVLLFMLSSKSA